MLALKGKLGLSPSKGFKPSGLDNNKLDRMYRDVAIIYVEKFNIFSV